MCGVHQHREWRKFGSYSMQVMLQYLLFIFLYILQCLLFYLLFLIFYYYVDFYASNHLNKFLTDYLLGSRTLIFDVCIKKCVFITCLHPFTKIIHYRTSNYVIETLSFGLDFLRSYPGKKDISQSVTEQLYMCGWIWKIRSINRSKPALL